ncbi:MAG: Hsp20/alpha crystallin family protein [Candidatus Rokubacteria bacterium]|nr:Hsp20/alpha crystallin family protein [Candidatus Rokubacteria bacterium]
MSVEPFRNLNDIQGEMNRLFDSETKDDLVLTFEIPGVREKDVNVSVTGDLLTVKGERQFVKELKDESCPRIERPYGKFERSVQVPMPVQADKVKATYRDGILEVRLPKTDEVKPKEIKIDIL